MNSITPGASRCQLPVPAPLDGTRSLTRTMQLRLAALSFRHMDGCMRSAALGIVALGIVLYAGFLVVLGVQDALQSSLILLAVNLVAIPASFPIAQSLKFRRWRTEGWLIGYFDDTATLLVRAGDDVWILSDHLAIRRGRGLAAPFRRRVFAHLAAEADRLGVAIITDTTSHTLARIYEQDMPGLQVIDTTRTDWCRRRLHDLRREPSGARRAQLHQQGLRGGRI